MLLLELPEFSVDVKSSSKVSLPLLVTILGHVTQTIEQLLRLLQEVAELVDNLPLFLVHGVGLTKYVLHRWQLSLIWK